MVQHTFPRSYLLAYHSGKQTVLRQIPPLPDAVTGLTE